MRTDIGFPMYLLWSPLWSPSGFNMHLIAFTKTFLFMHPGTQRRSLDQQICQEVGLFGLTHDRLLFFDWVQDDSLSVKAVVEVKLNTGLKAFDIEQN